MGCFVTKIVDKIICFYYSPKFNSISSFYRKYQRNSNTSIQSNRGAGADDVNSQSDVTLISDYDSEHSESSACEDEILESDTLSSSTSSNSTGVSYN